MYCVKELRPDVFWVGGNDRRLSLFENVFPIPRGVSYNSYVILDEKTVLMDTVDRSISDLFFENLTYALNGRSLDYLIVNHMEPDHCATMQELLLHYPDVTIVGNSKTFSMIRQFFNFETDSRSKIVHEGDVLCTGRHSFQFFMAPMVHWPEVMICYDTHAHILFSADAFGTFGSLSGSIYADELSFQTQWLCDARRYFSNIVGKYGVQVQALLKKLSPLDIELLCPLHGPVWRQDIPWFLQKYQLWSQYKPEEDAVMVAYASVYGNTENAVDILCFLLGERGIHNIIIHDVSRSHPSYIVSDAFRCSHLIFASTTYNGEIFCNMDTVLRELTAHNLRNRTIGLIQNGSWSPTAGPLMKAQLSQLKNMTILEPCVDIRSSIKSDQFQQLTALADAIAHSFSTAPSESKGV